MSGHSKWSTIKHKKAATDAKRSKIFTKLSKEIIVAAKHGESDPEMNFRLRMAIQTAKDNNMPAENIERAVKKGSGEGSDGDTMAELIYEGYGPGGVGIMLEILTDNRNRTVSNIRSTLTRAGGNMAESGAVAWQFEQKGVIIIEATETESEEIALIAIEQGASDFETYDGSLHIYSDPSNLEVIRTALLNTNVHITSTELSMVPSSTVMLETTKALQTLKLLDNLEELEDVQKVYSNADFPEDALENFEVA
jgi:YebC/PmpR family DNA-binding regulatory protein